MTPEERKAAADLYRRTGWRAPLQRLPSDSIPAKSDRENNKPVQPFSLKPLSSTAGDLLMNAAVLGFAFGHGAESYLIRLGAVAVGIFVLASPRKPRPTRGRSAGDYRYDGDSDGDFGGE